MRAAKDTTVLVTGATDGIGKATARKLAEAGARVVVHGRNEAKVSAVVDELEDATGNAHVEGLTFDLASLQAIRDGAAKFLATHDALNVLINNAGVLVRTRRVTGDGFETTFQVNHLAPFLLTELLLPALKRGAPARIVNVSSALHRSGSLDFEDLQFEHGYTGYAAYSRSKLANVLHANALARSLDPREITANSLHPGVIATNLLREGFGSFGGGPVEHGAETSVYLALSPDVEGVTGKYFDDSHETPATRAASDVALQEVLWNESARLVGRAA